MKFDKTKIALGLGIVALMLLFWVLIPSSKNNGKQFGKVEKGDILQRVTIAGVVTPNRRTLITAPYNGYVRKIHVKVGDAVKQGDPIVSLSQSLASGEMNFPLRAPFPGVVVQVPKSEGEQVRDSDAKDFIVRVDDLSKLYISAMAPEIERVKLKVGQEVVLKAAAILNRSYKGVIRELSLAATEKEQWGRSQVEFPVRIEITDADKELSPGMSVIGDITANKKEAVLTLRHEYLQKEDDGVYVTLKNGEKRKIEVGLQNEDAFEVLSGIKEGEEVRQVDFTSLIQAN